MRPPYHAVCIVALPTVCRMLVTPLSAVGSQSSCVQGTWFARFDNTPVHYQSQGDEAAHARCERRTSSSYGNDHACYQYASRYVTPIDVRPPLGTYTNPFWPLGLPNPSYDVPIQHQHRGLTEIGLVCLPQVRHSSHIFVFVTNLLERGRVVVRTIFFFVFSVNGRRITKLGLLDGVVAAACLVVVGTLGGRGRVG